MEINKFEKLKQTLNLNSDIIGVKLIYEHNKNINISHKIKEAVQIERYSENVNIASHGEF